MQERVEEIISLLKSTYGDQSTALSHKNALELLVATILSAQCTDKRVNMVTKDLFKKYKTASDYANADIAEFEEEIKSTGFYKNKAKNIISACQKIVSDFSGEVPKTIAELTTLPGVGRKTANIVLSEGYGIIEGIAVDTHVKRVSFRIGFTVNTDPEKIELDLMNIIPKSEWRNISNLFIIHGRETCIARRPKCSKCVLDTLCPKAGVTAHD